MPPAGVLRTRLLPPRIPGDALPRRALVGRVVRGLSGRLVVVRAGAGYGKSTLLAQALQADGRPWVWCSCDERLSAASAFLAHLAAGTAERFPGFGAGLRLAGDPAQQVAEFANEVLATVADDFTLALDDVHTLAGGDAAEALALLLTDLPATAHVVVTARGRVPVAVSRLRAQGVVEIGEEALALTGDETVRLLQARGRSVAPEAAAELHRRTEGWVAGLLMAAESGRALPERTPGSDGAVFDYLAEEVFLRQPERRRALLTDAATLERFTVDLLAGMAGDADRAEVADALADHAFTVPLEADGWYRFHHLFQAFLARRLEESPPAERADAHRRAAGAWRTAGEPAEAVPHLIAAGDVDAALDAIEPLAAGLVDSPQASVLGQWLDALPRERWVDRPGIALAHATLLFARADFEAAFAALEDQADRLLPAGEHERAALAMIRLLQALGAAGGGQQERGIAAGRRYLERLDPGARLAPAARVMLAGMYGYACRYEEAEAELRAAEESPIARLFPLLLTYAATTRAFFVDRPLGRGDATLAALDQAIGELEAQGERDVLAYLPYARAYRSVVLSEAGSYEEALAEAGRVREAAERRGLGPVAEMVVAWLRFAALAGLGRHDELTAELASSSGVFSRLGGGGRTYLRHAAVARMAAARGDRAAVEEAVQAARPGLAAQGYAFEESIRLADLARAAGVVDALGLARGLASDALAAAERARAPWARARAALVGAAVDDGAAGDRLLHEALAVTRDHDLTGLWTLRERALAGPLLARALVAGLGPNGEAARLAAACGGAVLEEALRAADALPSAARARLVELAADAPDAEATELARLGRDPDPLVRAAAERALERVRARPRPPLRILSFGGLRVLRGGVALPEAAFGRQKARALLAALMCSGTAVHREELLEWLWPDLPPDRGLRSLHTTVYELRRALEPGLASAGASVVAGDGETYRLRLAERDEWDAARMSDLAREAAAAPDVATRVARLTAAEELASGPFLPEWPYEPWADVRRAAVEEAYRGVLAALAEAQAASGRPEAAIARYRRLVALEPEREAWHRGLMRVYADAGERGLALRQFHACRVVLRNGLGIEPGPETQALYRVLLGAA